MPLLTPFHRAIDNIGTFLCTLPPFVNMLPILHSQEPIGNPKWNFFQVVSNVGAPLSSFEIIHLSFEVHTIDDPSIALAKFT